MSRNEQIALEMEKHCIVTSREGRVSRNEEEIKRIENEIGHVPRGACE